jgi:hypothetical protein
MGYGRAVKRKRRKRGAAAALIGLTALLISALTPGGAAALDSDLKHAAAFRVDASNGYEILALANSQRADGSGEIVLFVTRRNAGVVYVAPAELTATRVEADLGRLGEVSLDVVPSGRTRRLHSRCGEEGRETITFEPQSYRGNFEFHGEEGFTEATSTSPTEYTRFFVDLFCFGSSRGEMPGPMLPGARLRLRSHRGASRLSLQANKNRPGARTRLEVETHEMRQGIAISRSRTVWAGSGAFDFDPLLRTATLAPPAPFSGRAEFYREAANRWSGDLTVDLPGRSHVHLTGSSIDATLVPACLSSGRGC